MDTESTPSNSQPVFEVSKNILDFGTLQQGNKGALQVVIRNNGEQPLHWYVGTGGVRWLNLDKSSGILQPGEQMIVNVIADTRSLKLGSYDAAIMFTYEGDDQSKTKSTLMLHTRFKVAQPSNRENTDLDELDKNTEERASMLRIRITEEPLTAHNLTSITSSLTELYTKCWLIQQGRFAHLMEYELTHDIRIVEEANLVIARLRHTSPTLIDILINSANVGGATALLVALTKAIDVVLQAPLRFKLKKIEVEKAQLEIDKLRYETAIEIVDTLYPGADTATKAMLVPSLMFSLSNLGKGKEFELAQKTLPKPTTKSKRRKKAEGV